MKFKYFALLLSLTSISQVYGAQRNLCDDLIDSGTSSPEQIKKCLDDPRFGPSEYYKAQETKKKLQADKDSIKIEKDKAAEANTDKNRENLEIKKFNVDDLFDAGFGKPFYAIRGDYRNNRYTEKRITEGDALCSYLGYEKAIKSIVSPELWENKNQNTKVDKQGLIIDTNIAGTPSKSPEIYRDENFKFTVRKYLEITCVRRKDKTINGSTEMIKTVTEDLVTLNEELNSAPKNDSNSINNQSRSSGKTGTTSNGYIPPDWVQDAQSVGK